MPVGLHINPLRPRPNSVAQRNPILGIAIGSKQRQAKATGKATLYRNKYLNCRGRRQKKGKPFYPDDPSQKSCKSQYTRWNKWRGKSGKRADKFSKKLDKKGKLTDEARVALQEDIDKAERDALEDLRTTRTTVSAPRSQSTAASGEFPEEIYDEEGYLVEEDDTSVLPMVIGGVVVLGVLGGIAYAVTR